MVTRPYSRSIGRARLVCARVVSTAAICAGAVAVAAVLHAPPVALAATVVLGIVCPVVAWRGLPPAVGALRGHARLRVRDLARLRRELDRLPEVEHPLGL